MRDTNTGVLFLTKELGFLFVSDLEDLQLHELVEQERTDAKVLFP